MPDPIELFLARSDGGGESMIFEGTSSWYYRWSPTGSAIAILEYGSDISTIGYIAPDGSELSVQREEGSPEQAFHWSPDGRYLVSQWWRGGNRRVVAYRLADGTSFTAAEMLAGNQVEPVGWLPDGELLVVKAQGGVGELASLNLDDRTERVVADLGVRAGWGGSVALSPDGLQLAIVVEGAAGRCDDTQLRSYGLWVLKIQSGTVARVSDDTCGMSSPLWSQDGAQLAYSVIDRSDLPNRGLYFLDIATGDSRQVTDKLDQGTNWLADGRILVRRYACIGCEGPSSTVAIEPASGDEAVISENSDAVVSIGGDRIAAGGDRVRVLALGGEELNTLRSAEDGWGAGQVAWSPDDQYVSYLRAHSDGTRTFRINADGSGFRQLNYQASNTTLSPDGTHMAYESWQGTVRTLMVADADGSNEVEVGTNAIGFQWSRDGSRLAYRRMEQGETGSGERLWLADGDGTGSKPIGGVGLINFAWSPDGTRLLFIADGGARGLLYLVDKDGDGLHLYDIFPQSLGYHIQWSPDGSHAVVSGTSVFYIVDLRTLRFASLAVSDPGYGTMAWSADGSTLAVPTMGVVKVVSADGTERMTFSLTVQNRATDVSLSPDGLQVGYVDYASPNGEAQVMIGDVTSGDSHVVLTGEYSFGSPVPVWSPDGEHIALSMMTDDGEGLFVMTPDGLGRRQITRCRSTAEIRWLDNERIEFTTFLGGL